MKKREFWELIEKQDGSCKGIMCPACPNWNKEKEKCKTHIKHPEIDKDHLDCKEYQTARLDDALDWLARHPKKDKGCTDCANYKPKHGDDRVAVEKYLKMQRDSWMAFINAISDSDSEEKPKQEDKPFVPATEFIPGKFYQSEDGLIVFCQDGKPLSEINFYGVLVNNGGLPYELGDEEINGGWNKHYFSGPLEVKIKVVE